MALVKNNITTEGLSGMLGGKLVFRSYRNKTIVSVRPQKPKKESRQQRDNRNKFKEATAWAKEKMKDQEAKIAYQAKAKELGLPNAYTAAVTDYMRKPLVEEVQFEGNKVTVKVTKKGFEISQVAAIVFDGFGKEIALTSSDNIGNKWVFHFSIQLKEGFVARLETIDETGNKHPILIS